MENFANNTDVSFNQLLKKDGWFSRLIFSQLIVFPVYIFLFRIARPLGKMSGFSFYFLLTIGFIWIAGHLTIGFLLWKKRTRLTITVSIILLWILLIWSCVLPLLLHIMMLYTAIHYPESNKFPINYWNYKLIYTAVVTFIILTPTVIWTRKLKRLKSLCP